MQTTSSTHPWSASFVNNPDMQLTVDGADVFVPGPDDDGKIVKIVQYEEP